MIDCGWCSIWWHQARDERAWHAILIYRHHMCEGRWSALHLAAYMFENGFIGWCEWLNIEHWSVRQSVCPPNRWYSCKSPLLGLWSMLRCSPKIKPGPWHEPPFALAACRIFLGHWAGIWDPSCFKIPWKSLWAYCGFLEINVAVIFSNSTLLEYVICILYSQKDSGTHISNG